MKDDPQRSRISASVVYYKSPYLSNVSPHRHTRRAAVVQSARHARLLCRPPGLPCRLAGSAGVRLLQCWRGVQVHCAVGEWLMLLCCSAGGGGGGDVWAVLCLCLCLSVRCRLLQAVSHPPSDLRRPMRRLLQPLLHPVHHTRPSHRRSGDRIGPYLTRAHNRTRHIEHRPQSEDRQREREQRRGGGTVQRCR